MPKPLPLDKLPLPDDYGEQTIAECESHLEIRALRGIQQLAPRVLSELREAERFLLTALPTEADPEWHGPNPSGLTYAQLYDIELAIVRDAARALTALLHETGETIEVYRRAYEVDALP